jgi:outer membrane protein insertion porin family
MLLVAAGLISAVLSSPASGSGGKRVVGIAFEGNRSFAGADLRALAGWEAGRPLESLDLAGGLRRLSEAYAARGFLDAAFRPDTLASGGGLLLSVTIREGERTRIGSLELEGVEAMSPERARSLLGLREGSVFDRVRVERGIRALLLRYGSLGYPYARAEIEDLAREGALVDLVVRVTEAGVRRLGAISFRGLDHVREASARRWTRLEPEDLYDEGRLDRAAAHLARTGLFREVREPEVFLMEGDRVGVLFRVVERRRTNRISGVLGVSQGTGENEASLSGRVDAAFPNLGGTGRSVEVSWSDNGEGRSTTRVAFAEPWFLDSPFGLSLELRRIRQDTVSTWQSLGIDLEYPFAFDWTASLGYSVDRDVFEAGAVARTLRQRGRLGLRYGPVALSGQACCGAWLVVQGASKAIHLREPGPGGGSRGQLLYEAGGFRLVSPGETHHLYARVEARGTLSDEEELPLSEQHYLGGATTLRGYREEQFRGREIAFANLEYRLGGAWEDQLFLFSDAGGFRRGPGGGGRWTVKTGYGFGLRSRSALGSVELSFGVGEEISLRATKVHVSLSQEF